ncbi:hypothetical protein [Mycolicibacter minnesotensis]|uniref:hypothetical protein n=1 Tax=Mycolicibacter minnesotensis TaxID=1118379 RepID=UPI0021F26D69|nr:hypothetical protein [Mycolicibacter minnesotensis]
MRSASPELATIAHGVAALNLESVPDPATYRPAPGSIPVEPGVYRFRDPHGRVIYVGKAKSRQ